MYEGLLAETVTITGNGGDEIGAYLARPLGLAPFPGVIVIHHAPGWDEGTRRSRASSRTRLHRDQPEPVSPLRPRPGPG